MVAIAGRRCSSRVQGLDASCCMQCGEAEISGLRIPAELQALPGTENRVNGIDGCSPSLML